jgi:transposase-like protein
MKLEMKNRKIYSSELKTRVVVEMLREELSTSQIAAKYGIHQTILNKWRNVILEGLPTLFADPRKKSASEREKEVAIEALYCQVGKLSMQLEWLKKKCGVDLIPQ